MKQKTMGFLEYLYHGELHEDLFHMDTVNADENKVASFMDAYTKAISIYPPRELEKLGTIPDDLMQGLRKSGIFGLTIPEEYGGLGFSPTEYLRAVEEMAHLDMALVLVPLGHLSIGLKAILLFGTEEQKKKYLTQAASGSMIFAYALTEPAAGSDAQHISTKAVRSDDGSYYTLNGSKTYITNGNYAGGFTVFAQLGDEKNGHMGAFIVERAWEGMNVGKDMPKMGLTVSSTAAIQFRDVKVPAENLIGEEGNGFKVAMNVLNYGRLALGAASAGGMHQSLRDMLERANKRIQFSVPIKSFELIQEKIVRAQAHGLASRAMTYFTAGLLEKNPFMNVAMESSHCKLYGTDKCWDTLYDALQTAGGAGFLATMPYEKRMRDARVTTIFEGTSEIHSIYPPLTLFRLYAKQMKKRGSIGGLISMMRLSSKRLLKSLNVSDSRLQRALDAACRSEAIFRKLAYKGLVKYKQNIVHKEFFLRRMTRISMSLFTLVSAVAYLRNKKSKDERELLALDYLIEEAKHAQKEFNFVEGDEIEHVHHKLFAALDADNTHAIA